MRTVSLITCVLLGGILLFRCFPPKSYMNYKEKKKKSCLPYYRYVKENWKMNNDSLFVFINPPSYDSSLHMAYEHINKPCIIGLTKKQVLRLFGKPSEIEGRKFQYFRKEECFKKEKPKIGCSQLTLTFDSKVDTIIGVSLPSPIRKPIPGMQKDKN